MQGTLDQYQQAFLNLDLGQGPIAFLIDTGFDGALIVGDQEFNVATATPAGTITAELASRQLVDYPMYLVELEWFSQHIVTHVLLGPGQECLLGTALLSPHRLEIDYGQRTVELLRGETW